MPLHFAIDRMGKSDSKATRTHVVALHVYMQGASERTNEKESLNQTARKMEREREEKRKKQHQLQAKWSPSTDQQRKIRRRRKKDGVYIRLELRQVERTREKKTRGEKKSCTYTTAIARVRKNR